MRVFRVLVLLLVLCTPLLGQDKALVRVGADLLFESPHKELLRGKRIGLIANQTAIDSKLVPTLDLLREHRKTLNYTIVSLFAPEHGLKGEKRGLEKVENSTTSDNIPVYSLYGATVKPTPEMLKGLDILLFDIQDIGSRSYTFTATLFYAMEAAAQEGVTVMVLDRPNPISGLLVDGPVLQDRYRSIVGYLNVPYCHGMTVGELAQYFNAEYKVGCKLHVVPMKGWRRDMFFDDTGLAWIPTSPQVPEASTALFYPTTGIIGELGILSLGGACNLPFKIVGAPWIHAETFAAKLNEQKFPGVTFLPFYFRPFTGKYVKNTCNGVLIIVTDRKVFKPVQTQYLILGMLKTLYPEQIQPFFDEKPWRLELFHKINGTEEVFRLLKEERYITWKLKGLHESERRAFLERRKPYLLY